MVKVKLFYYLS